MFLLCSPWWGGGGFLGWFVGWKRKEGKEEEGVYVDLLENPTRLKTVTLCAVSAHRLPLTTNRSHIVDCAALSLNRASRNRATFSAGVSSSGVLPFLGSIGGGGVRVLGLSRAVGVDRGVLGAEYAEGGARLMDVGLV